MKITPNGIELGGHLVARVIAASVSDEPGQALLVEFIHECSACDGAGLGRRCTNCVDGELWAEEFIAVAEMPEFARWITQCQLHGRHLDVVVPLTRALLEYEHPQFSAADVAEVRSMISEELDRHFPQGEPK